MNREPVLKYAVCLSALLYISSASAELPPAEKEAIDHLLKFVSQTSCKINRNGSFHDGPEAVAHIRKKYDYFKDKILTAEEFIDYSATKSTMSGTYYLVQCGQEEPKKTREWLLEELGEYRAGSK
ncbi:DUF5329 domain-containing protein [Solemya velum gill symbiont]|uniref:DUF5329 domain-containing protein n=1 Tax=Solemya velum gill symbiont TaxID=2340 RepID=A0A0B0HF34_SOVGS|nr:DUF5329 domain-containing protein [Solemya velum gill symbiont]KHF26529.1 hypothetical protein JV46_17480 [Solemya velum gill symbiont]OOY35414.1 hypothetical protein BOV88_03960 [Solemya velum gill symbiont]OOY38633.1 hypothetical protein BOV89_02215 [Solemya velum gill symbiont]OOY39567.1 hypothetical protein BOV90_08575 [Solemya velum gill symbiont]OOY43882.1 hypothetical protein BOV91_02830 [Solemya velum gill symbiont]